MSEFDLDQELEDIKAELDAMDAHDAAPQPAPKKKKKGSTFGRILYFGLLAIFITVFLLCGKYIWDYIRESRQQAEYYDDLSQLVDQNRPSRPKPTFPPATEPQPSDPSQTVPDPFDPTGPSKPSEPTEPSAPTEPPVPTEPTILPEYQELYNLNNHLVGWITIPDTKIDYPVVQSPDKPDFYLNHDYGKKWSAAGCIYAREECDIFTPSDNITLYGHHMKNGSMFAQLDKYKKKSFWQDHQLFYFDTLYERHTYQVFAVFKTTANLGEGFTYHLFDDAANKEEFDAFIAQVHKLQFYNTGVTAEYGDKLLTLSTCEYTQDNGRFVVVAKRIS